jgi:hypothetical protein
MSRNNIKNLVILFIFCIILALVLSFTNFTKLQLNPIISVTILMTVSYILYFSIFYGTKYYKTIWSATYEKGKKKIEGILKLDFVYRNFFRFVILSIIIDFFALALLIDTPLKTGLSVIPFGDFFTPILGKISEDNSALQSTFGVFPYISSPGMMILASIGPGVVVLLKQVHIRYGTDLGDFPGSRILMIFLIISPIIIFLSGRTLEYPASLLFKLNLWLALVLAVATSFIYIGFMQLFYVPLFFSKTK